MKGYYQVPNKTLKNIDAHLDSIFHVWKTQKNTVNGKGAFMIEKDTLKMQLFACGFHCDIVNEKMKIFNNFYMRLLFLFICLCLFSCHKSVNQNKNIVSVEQDTQSVLLHNDWSKKRSEIQILSDYLKIGQNLDTIVKSYSELKYDSVLAINHLHGGMQAARDTSKLDTIMKFHTLTVQQSENLIKTLESKETYYDPMSARCFVPHTTFVFYSKNEIVAYSSICLRCGKIYSTIKLISGEKYSPLGRFGEKSFNSICKELNFSEFR